MFLWAFAVLLQLYYLIPAIWYVARRWSDISPLLALWLIGSNGLSLALIALRNSRLRPGLAATALVLRSFGQALTPAVGVYVAVLARRKPLWGLVYGLAAIPFALLEGFVQGWSTPVFAQSLIAGIVVTAAFSAGFGMRQAAALQQEKARRLEASRAADEARLEQVRLAERERLAREMHDVVAHRISLVAMASGALAYRDDLPPADVKQAAQLINDNAKRSLDELRLVLSKLRDSESVPAPPQPSLDQVPGLIAESRAAGQEIAFTTGTDLAAVPAQVSRHGYRAVQEALTNARKHAPGQAVTVDIAGGRGEGITITVANPVVPGSRGDGSRLGLVGLVERMELVGGRISSGETDGRFVLEAWLPW